MNVDKKILMVACLAGVSTFAGETWIDDYVAEAASMNKVCGAKEYPACRERLLRLERLLDGRVDIEYRLAKAEAMLGNKDGALEKLAIYSTSGLTFADPATAPEFTSLKSSPEFSAILARLKTAHEPRTVSKLFLTLPEPDLIAEDIAYDPAGEKFYVSSVRHRKILSIDKHGVGAEFLREGFPDVWAIPALGVGSMRRVLWAATAALPEAIGYRKEDEGRSALLKYSLDTGALLKRYDLKKSEKHALGDMTVSSAGEVYVSDGEGAVYWVNHQKDTLEILIEKGVFHNPQTPALTPEGRKLFVPDYSRAIGIVDLATRQVKLLEHP